jgi:hypothetical protein
MSAIICLLLNRHPHRYIFWIAIKIQISLKIRRFMYGP